MPSYDQERIAGQFFLAGIWLGFGGHSLGFTNGLAAEGNQDTHVFKDIFVSAVVVTVGRLKN